MSPLARIAAAAIAFATCTAAHAQISVSNAWMRPAAAGQKEAQLYVDIRVGDGVKLVGATSPVARRTELVLLDPPQADTGTLKVVREIDVPANQETRLAYRGSHVRLVDITRAVNPGERVRVELTFVDRAGKRTVLATQALVRGLVARNPDGSEIAQPAAK